MPQDSEPEPGAEFHQIPTCKERDLMQRLMDASADDDVHKAAEALVDGADPVWQNKKHKAEVSAMHIAAANGSFGALAAILSSVFDGAMTPCVGSRDWRRRRRRGIDFTDGRGWSALHWAAYGGHSACVALLLHYGASPDCADSQGMTPAYWALTAPGHGGAMAFCMALTVFRKAAVTSGRRMPLVQKRPSTREEFVSALRGDAVDAAKAIAAALAARSVEFLGIPGAPITAAAPTSSPRRGNSAWLRCPARDLHPDSVISAHKYLTMSNAFVRTLFWPWDAVGSIYRELDLPPARVVTPTSSAPASADPSDESSDDGSDHDRQGLLSAPSSDGSRRSSVVPRDSASSAAAADAAQELRRWVSTRPGGTDRRTSRRAARSDLMLAAAAVGDAAAMSRALDDDRGSGQPCGLVPTVSVLHAAARHEQPTCARLLLGRCDDEAAAEALGATDRAGCTPFHWAASAGSWRCVNALLQAAAGIPSAPHTGSPGPSTGSPTRPGAPQSSDAGGLAVRLQSRAERPDDAARRSSTSSAAQAGRGPPRHAGAALARCLLAAADCRGWTPLHTAAFRGHERAACLLLMVGADAAAQDAKGRSPLALAAGSGSSAATRLVIAFAHKAGQLNVNGRDSRGRTALHEAATYGCFGAAGVLLDADASATLGDRRSQTQLVSALASGAQHTALLICASLAARVNDTRSPEGPAASAPGAAAPMRTPPRTSARGFLRGVQRALTGTSPPRGTTARGATHVPRVAPSGPAERGVDDSGGAEGRLHDGSRARAADLATTAASLPTIDPVTWAVDAPAGPVVSSAKASAATPSPGTRVGLSTWIDSTLTLVSQLQPGAFSTWPAEALGDFIVSHTGPDMAVVFQRQTDSRSWALAHFAAGAGCLPILRAIGDADVEQLHALKPDSGQSVVHDACVNGRIECLRYLLSRSVPAGAPDKNGDTPLHWLAFKGFGRCARLLIDEGVGINVNSLNLDNGTPLHSAANNGDAGLGELLIRSGCDPNEQMADGNAPAHNAAFEGHSAFLRMLLDNGCRVDVVNGEGRVALHEAASNGHKGVMDLLLEHIARLPPAMVAGMLNQKDGGGDTPLHWAVCNNHAASTRALIEAGAHLDETNLDGGTPLHAAVINHSVTCLKLLLIYRCDPNAEFRSGASGEHETPLMVAVCEGDRESAAMLMEFGAKPDSVDSHGRTALHMACARRDTATAETLIEGGARLDVVSRAGFTPLALLGDASHSSAAEALSMLGETVASVASLPWKAPTDGGPGEEQRGRVISAVLGAALEGPPAAARSRAAGGAAAPALIPGLARAVSDPMTSASVAPAPADWRGFAPFFRDEMYADVKLGSNDGCVVPAHRVVLAARCPTLAGMLMGRFREAAQRTVRLDISGEVLGALVRHIYGAPREMPSSVEAAVAVCEAAEVYQLPCLRADAEVAAVACVSADVAAEAYVLARRARLLLLECACLRLASLPQVARHIQSLLDEAGEGGEHEGPRPALEAVSNLLHRKLRTSTADQIGLLTRFAKSLPRDRAAHDPGAVAASMAARTPVKAARPGLARA